MKGKMILQMMLCACILLCSGCTGFWGKGPTTEPTEEPVDISVYRPEVQNILMRVDNKTPAGELIKTIQTEADYLKYPSILWNSGIVEFDEIYNIECLRRSKGHYYTIIKSEQGHLLYLLFGQEGNDLKVKDDWRITGKITKKDFEDLRIGEATLEDVQALDPEGNYAKLYMGLVPGPGQVRDTIHYTVDGYVVHIVYMDPGLTVGRVIINKAEMEDTIYSYLLEQDRP